MRNRGERARISGPRRVHRRWTGAPTRTFPLVNREAPLEEGAAREKSAGAERVERKGARLVSSGRRGGGRERAIWQRALVHGQPQPRPRIPPIVFPNRFGCARRIS